MTTSTNIQSRPMPLLWFDDGTPIPVLFTVVIGGEQGEVILGEGGEGDEGIAEE